MIAIKDMQMPKRCAKCRFCTNKKTNDYGSFGECLLQDNKKVNRNSVNNLVWSRDSDCPLVEIVTCKECKSECTEKNGEKFSETRPDFFCADAERKE